MLSDHVDGVLCQGNPQRILDILRQNGFTLENENTDDQKASWTVVQGGHGDGGEQPVHPPAPHPTHDNEADGGDEEERAGGDAEEEEEKKDEEEEEEEEDKDAEKWTNSWTKKLSLTKPDIRLFHNY